MRIAASRVAAAAGLHPYCSRDEVFDTRDRKELAIVEGASGRRDPKEILAGLRAECALVASESDAQELDEKEGKVLETLRDLYTSEEDGEVLRKFVKSAVATSRGVARERGDLARYARDLAPGTFVTRSLDLGATSVYITGVPDAIDKHGNVVETKHRRRRLFGNIPEYERIQLEVYMWLTRTHTCTHIENYDGAWNAASYSRDPDLWARVLEGLDQFVRARS